MKTLEHQTLLYDEDCPLCQVYTSGFIRTGMLDNNGRKPFTSVSKDEQKFIDIHRAANEIALVDNKNKTVIYGIDSILKVIGYRFPIIEKIGQLSSVNFLLKKLYAFISYNRKVIIPSHEKEHKTLECIPDFNIKYRALYILFAILVTATTLFYYSKNLHILNNASLSREGLITGGQIVFQGIIIYKLNSKTIMNYIGNLMTVSLLGSIILVPLLLLNNIFEISETLNVLWFGLTATLMFVEHFRRVKLLKLPGYLSYTWVVYRIIILLTLLAVN